MAQALNSPQISDLPSRREGFQNQFEFATGADFMGSFPITQCGKLATYYIRLYTRLEVRAVHLKISETFLHALQ